MSVFVKFETPKELSDKAYNLAEAARDGGKIKKGTNEVTKAVERGEALMVIMAEDHFLNRRNAVQEPPPSCTQPSLEG